MSIRRIAVLSTAALAVAGGVYSAYWFHASATLRKGLEQWAEHRRDDNRVAGWDALAVDGFPWRLRLRLEAPAVAAPDGHSWRAERLEAVASPLDPTRFRVDLGGRHHLGWAEGAATVTAGRAHAVVDLDRSGRLQEATLLASDVAVTPDNSDDGERMTAAGLAVTWDPLPTPADADRTSARFSLAVHDLELPLRPGLPLDHRLDLAEMAGRVTGPLPEDLSAAAIARWGADGGSVEVEHAALDWAPLALEGQGTLSLDAAGQPQATLTTRMRGVGPLMDRLAETGAVPADTATSAKMVLLLLARPDAKGRPAVPVPVSLQEGELYLGSARVARLGAVKWP